MDALPAGLQTQQSAAGPQAKWPVNPDPLWDLSGLDVGTFSRIQTPGGKPSLQRTGKIKRQRFFMVWKLETAMLGGKAKSQSHRDREFNVSFQKGQLYDPVQATKFLFHCYETE